MSGFPLAYHITVGTYGTRLHGDSRGTVDRSMNHHREPIIGRDEVWRREEESLLAFAPVILTVPQRGVIEAILPEICVKGGWQYHIAAVQPDHMHVLLSSPQEGKAVRRLLKRWVSQAISEKWPLEPGRLWWAECGSIKWIWTRDYFDNVFEYIRRQRALPWPRGSPD